MSIMSVINGASANVIALPLTVYEYDGPGICTRPLMLTKMLAEVAALSSVYTLELPSGVII